MKVHLIATTLIVVTSLLTGCASPARDTVKQSGRDHAVYTIKNLAVGVLGQIGATQMLDGTAQYWKIEVPFLHSPFGHVDGTVIRADESARVIVLNPKTGSTIAEHNGLKVVFMHLADTPQGELEFTVWRDSRVDWPRLQPGTQLSFHCKEQPDASWEITDMSVNDMP